MKIDKGTLEQAMVEHDLSIVELAHMADLHPQTLYKVGKGPLSRKSTRSLAKALRALQERRQLDSKAVG